MNRLKFYFEHSLIGYFCRRAREKWFAPPVPPPSPSQLDYFGVKIQLDCLPEGMQKVILSGSYETPEIKVLPGLILPSDRVLEIGAAIGFLGLFCRKNIKVTELVSVEPNPKTLACLLRNYELNQFKPNVIEAALTAVDGPVSFYTSDMFWTDSVVAGVEPGAGSQITVPGLTFESILTKAGINFNTLIIDMEGGEQFLQPRSIPEGIKKILIEIHPDMIGARSAYFILESLIRSGFQVHSHDHNTWAFRRD
jgi:FkbM family methyltransferase